MKKAILLIQLIVIGTFYSYAQNTKFFPEITLGNRAVSYQHFVDYNFSESWSINNVTLFDTEYNNEDNNIFFIRNMLSYSPNKSFKTNVAFGVKNPGSFISVTTQYLLSFSNFKAAYAVGSTYQDGFTLEQSLSLYYSKPITESIEIFSSFFTVFNTNLKYLDRGIQQIRVGLKKEAFQLSMAFNFDQFKKAEKTLENYGIAFKYNF